VFWLLSATLVKFDENSVFWSALVDKLVQNCLFLLILATLVTFKKKTMGLASFGICNLIR